MTALSDLPDSAQASKSKGITLYPWYVVTVLMLAQTCSFIDRMIMGLLVGPVRSTFGISDTQYSLLAGLAFSVFYALMGLPLARIADSKSRRALIAVGITVWSLMTALCGLAKGFWSLFAARVGVGVGEASLSPAAYSMITDYFPRRTLAKALSVYTIGVTVGSGLAYMIGGKVVTYVGGLGQISLPVIGNMHGWQLTFIIVGLPGLVIALLMATVKEPPRLGKANADCGSKAVPISALIQFLRDNRIAVGTHIVGVSIFIMVVFGTNIWGPTYLIRTFGFAPGQAGWVFGLVMMIAGTIGLMLGGSLADRLYNKGRADAYSRVIAYSIVGMLPFSIMLGFATEPAMGIAALTAATFFSAFQGGIAAGTLQLMTPNELRGQVAAIYFLVANLIGLGLGPTVVASITDFVFRSDAAIGKSLALSAAVLCPVALAILLAGLGHVRKAVQAVDTKISQGA